MWHLRAGQRIDAFTTFNHCLYNYRPPNECKWLRIQDLKVLYVFLFHNITSHRNVCFTHACMLSYSLYVLSSFSLFGDKISTLTCWIFLNCWSFSLAFHFKVDKEVQMSIRDLDARFKGISVFGKKSILDDLMNWKWVPMHFPIMIQLYPRLIVRESYHLLVPWRHPWISAHFQPDKYSHCKICINSSWHLEFLIILIWIVFRETNSSVYSLHLRVALWNFSTYCGMSTTGCYSLQGPQTMPQWEESVIYPINYHDKSTALWIIHRKDGMGYLLSFLWMLLITRKVTPLGMLFWRSTMLRLQSILLGM